MSKFLAHKYTINVADNSVTIPEYINQERFLLITDVTTGENIFSFADSQFGITSWSFDAVSELTTIVLAADFATYNVTSNSKLQIFYDKAGPTEFEPSDSILDPVHKLRVSSPENLIDTDFEYGLQPTKWETLETSNNIPSFYVGDGDLPLSGVMNVITVAGSDVVTVYTSDQHGLAQGTPIDVQGVSSRSAEGKFLIASADTNSFTYKGKSTQASSGNIGGVYTTITPGAFYHGSSIPFDVSTGLQSDEGTPSSITITTPSDHGFVADSNFYLVNTVGTKALELSNTTTSNAPDGFPYVDPDNIITINASADSSLTETRQIRSRWFLKFNASSVDTSANTITWPAHGMKTNDCLLYDPPVGDSPIGGLSRFSVYYVIAVDTDTIRLSTSFSGAAVDFTTAGTYTYGRSSFHLVYEVARMYAPRNNYSSQFYTKAQENSGTGSGWDLLNAATTLGGRGGIVTMMPFSVQSTSIHYYMHRYVNWPTPYWVTPHGGIAFGTEADAVPTKFNFVEDFSRWSTQNWVTNTSYWSEQSYGLYWYNKYRYDGTYNFGTNPGTTFLFPVVYDEEGESIYIQDHGLRTGDTVTYNGPSSGNRIIVNNPMASYTLNAVTSSLSNGNYVVDVISSDRFRIRGKQLYSANGVHDFTFQAQKKTSNSFYLEDHGFTTNQPITITTTGSMPTTTSGPVAPIMNPSTVNALPKTFNVIDQAIQDRFTSLGVTPIDLTTYGASSATNTLVLGNGGIPNILNSFNLTTGNHYAVYNTTGQSVYANLNYYNPAVLNSSTATNIYTGTVYENRNHLAMATDWKPNITIPYYLMIRSTDFASPTESYYEVFQDNQQFNSASNYFYSAYSIGNRLYNTTNGSGTQFKYGLYASNFYYGTQRYIHFRIRFSKTNDSTNWYNPSNIIPVPSTNNNTYSYTYFNAYYTGRTVDISLSFAVDNNNSFDTTASTLSFADSILEAYDTNMVYPSINNGDQVNINIIDNNRFSIKKGGTLVDLTDSGTAPFTFTTTAQLGVLDGIYSASSVTSRDITIQTTANINGQTASIDASTISGSVIPLLNGTHSFRSGTAVVYDNNGNADITELTNGNTYYVIVVDDENIALSENAIDASNGSGEIQLTAGTGTHLFKSTSLAGVVPGQGTVTVVSGSTVVSGTDTLFKRYFKVGDNIFVKDNNSTPGTINKYEVTSIAEDATLTVDAPFNFSATGTLFFVETKVYARPDGYAIHRPFDGGVEIAAGTAPLSRITRQTRKYFRYQSGKGIQTSLAINFNPPVVLDTINASGTTVTCTTKYPHRMSDGQAIEISGSTDISYNVQKEVTVVDDSTFTITLDSAPAVSNPSGIIQYNLRGYSDAYVRAGMFDDQNGFFYEYNGQTLYVCRRSSTTQLSGTVTAVKGSGSITGVNTNFRGQLVIGDNVVIRGTSYKIVSIDGTSVINVQPQYRGISASGIIMTKTETVRIPQDQWNEDTCDGTGPEGFLLNIDKIQMAYMDYSWYGAGKLRFGFKDRKGHVRYVHSFLHNNRLDEAYMRSGNLPAKYEIVNGPNPTYAPTLFHWGTSVIMDGTFDDDKAYLFTAPSKSLSFSNGDTLTSTTSSTSNLTASYNRAERAYDWYVAIPFPVADAGKFYTGLKLYTAAGQLTGEEVAYTQYSGSFIYAYVYIQTSRSQPTVYASVPTSTVVNLGTPAGGGGADVKLGTAIIPMVSLRLSPSVDTNLSGALGARDIINRMQLQLNEVGLILSHDCEVKLILNGDLSNVNWESVKNPSLSQLVKHDQGDIISGGTEVFSFRASGGAVDNTGKRGTLASNFPLGEIIDMGNSILGGDGTYPNGPDVLTVAVKVVDTGGIRATNPFSVSGRITWSESQA